MDSMMEAYSSVAHFTKQNPVPPAEDVPQQKTKMPRLDDEEELDDEEDEEEAEGVKPSDVLRRNDGKYLTHYIPLVPGGVPVTGFVRITAPAGRVVSHNGIKAVLEASLFALQDVATRDLYSEEITLVGPDDVEGTVDIPFAFMSPARETLPDSYEGDLYSIRHSIAVNISRPWFTFDVNAETPFEVQTLHTPPAGLQMSTENGAGASKDGSGGGGADPTTAVLMPRTPLPPSIVGDPKLLGEQQMRIEGLDSGASVVLHLDRACYEVNECIRGTLVCTNIRKPIVLVKLAVVRIEYADGEVSDNAVFDDAVMDARRWKMRKDRVRIIEKVRKAQAAAAAAEAAASAVSIAVHEGDGSGSAAAAAAPAPGAAEGGAGAAAPQITVTADAAADDEDEDKPEDWRPDPSEYESEEVDPDLPILGDANLSIDLDLSLLNVTPTLVINLDEGAAAAAPKEGQAEEDRNEISVRYFIRLTLYTAFDAQARRWNAQEVVLFRQRLTGQTVPVHRLPRPLAEIRREAAAAAAAAGQAPDGGDRAPVMLPAPLQSGLNIFAGGAGGKQLARLEPRGGVGGVGAASPVIAAAADAESGMEPPLSSLLTKPVALQSGGQPRSPKLAGSPLARAPSSGSFSPGAAAPVSPAANPLTEADVDLLRGKPRK